ncbi:MAG TPA: TetR/AcrR family transcriptional regulator [Acidimicrobiales bacterium]|nr:TetR/AcrR family transcriptional regulator [Acidimicrobiales bacterium]
MAKQSRSVPVMQAVLDAVAERLMTGDELLIRIPEICEATGVNYGSVYHHFGSREGVIDAAYNMMFSKFVEEDMEIIREATDNVVTLEEYVSVILPIVAMMNSGPERTARRALRIRIVSAAMTRPELHTLISETQSRLTQEWRRLIEMAQKREWLRDDISAGFLAVMLQIIVFGRALDDISDTPVDEAEWGSSIATLFVELLKREGP